MNRSYVEEKSETKEEQAQQAEEDESEEKFYELLSERQEELIQIFSCGYSPKKQKIVFPGRVEKKRFTKQTLEFRVMEENDSEKKNSLYKFIQLENQQRDECMTLVRGLMKSSLTVSTSSGNNTPKKEEEDSAFLEEKSQLNNENDEEKKLNPGIEEKKNNVLTKKLPQKPIYVAKPLPLKSKPKQPQLSKNNLESVIKEKKRKRSLSHPSKPRSKKLSFEKSKFSSFGQIPENEFFYNEKSPKNASKKPILKELHNFTLDLSLTEFLDRIINNNGFYTKYHAEREDKDIELPHWCQESSNTYSRVVKFLMRVKMSFTSRNFTPVIHRNRVTVLENGAACLWQQSFQTRGFIGSDSLLLISNVYIFQVSERKIRIVIRAASIFVKSLNFVLKWKFNSVGNNILEDCFSTVKKKIIEVATSKEFDHNKEDPNNEKTSQNQDSNSTNQTNTQTYVDSKEMLDFGKEKNKPKSFFEVLIPVLQRVKFQKLLFFIVLTILVGFFFVIWRRGDIESHENISRVKMRDKRIEVLELELKNQMEVNELLMKRLENIANNISLSVIKFELGMERKMLDLEDSFLQMKKTLGEMKHDVKKNVFDECTD